MDDCRKVELDKGGLRLMETGAEIGFDQAACFKRLIDKEGKGCASAEGLDADGTGSGKKIEYVAACYPFCKDIEEGFAYPVAGRPDVGLA
jgi:hypothetical protein